MTDIEIEEIFYYDGTSENTSTPDEEVGPLTEVDSTFGALSYGETESAPGNYCSGGGNITINANDTFTDHIFVKRNGMTSAEMEARAAELTAKNFQKDREAAQQQANGGALQCAEVNCQDECTSKSSWSFKLAALSKTLIISKFQVNQPEEEWLLTVKITIQANYVLYVRCICEE